MDQSKKYLEEEIKRVEAEIENVRKLVGELGEEAIKEIEKLRQQKEELERALNTADKASGANTTEFGAVIVEVRPGVGGEEAKIWAEDVLRMYMRHAETRNWKVEIMDEGIIKIKGDGVFEALKFETGVHRVQRVPQTEAQGRIHTSTASVVVLPEVGEREIEIREDDLAWEFIRGTGHGGQNVNKVATAVRLTHKPTGIAVQSKRERFQEQNRRIALALLRAQLWEIEQEEKRSKIKDQRLKIGRSMRAEKIRTYNFPQNRVTDHRIGKSWYKLDRIIDGEMDEVVLALSRLQ